MRLTDAFNDVLEPVRDIYIAELLADMAHALEAGDDVEAEPMRREADGRIARLPGLSLPMRHDFALRRSADARLYPKLFHRTRGSAALRFAPIVETVSDFAAARIAPFNWGAAEIALRASAGRAPDWTPLRLWYLEWFQPRFGEESPDLLGVTHRLSGPTPEGGGWRFTVDLGSCSVRGFAAMLSALAHAGCADIRIGETEDAL